MTQDPPELLRDAEAILAAATEATAKGGDKASSMSSVLTFCLSRHGFALVAAVVVAAFLFILAPAYVWDEAASTMRWQRVAILAAISGVLVYFAKEILPFSFV